MFDFVLFGCKNTLIVFLGLLAFSAIINSLEITIFTLVKASRRTRTAKVARRGFWCFCATSGFVLEHRAVRERAGLFDVSHMGQIELRGPRAIAATDSLVTCDVESLATGRARYGLMLNEEAGCIDDVLADTPSA